jgi:putative ATPase
LAIAPKSNSTGAVFSVIDHIKNTGIGLVPGPMRDKTASKLESRYTGRKNESKDYKYPHNFPWNWVKQQYLPDSVKNQSWFKPGSQGREKSLWDRLQAIKTGISVPKSTE